MTEDNDTRHEDGNTTTTTTINYDNNTRKNNNNNIGKNDSGATTNGVVTVEPPDGGWGWAVVASSFLISVLVDGVCFSFGIFFDEFRNEFGTSKAVTSWIGSVLNGSYLIFGPLVSALVNMYGCRKVTLFGAVLASVAFFISTFSPNIGVLIFTYGFLGGLGFGFMYLPAIVMVGYYFERRRALATGIACCGSGIGAFLFAPFTEYLLHEYGWRGAHWILAALVCHGFACAIFYRPLHPPATKNSQKKLAGGKKTEEILLISPGQGDDRMIDMTDVRPASSVNNGGQKSPISDELKIQIYERLKADNNLPPVYRTRSMTLHTPQITPDGHNFTAGTNGLARLAFSQDFSLHQRKRPAGHRSDPTHNISVPPLQRKDIFYSGSIWHLKEFKEMGSAEEYRRKIAEPTVQGDAQSTSGEKGFIQSFVSVFDISLLKSPTFLIYGASCFLCMAGFFVPFIYMPTHAIDMGLDSTMAAYLISIIGITNTVGRVAVGFISDQPWADCLMINNVALIIGGVATLFVPYYTYYYLLAIYAAVFGTAIAVFVSLRSIIMVKLMGLEKLTTAFGFVIMCQGGSSLLGPPLAGAISDSTGNYNAAFYFAGIALTLSGIICLPLRRIADWETKKKNMAAQADVHHGQSAKTRAYQLRQLSAVDETKELI